MELCLYVSLRENCDDSEGSNEKDRGCTQSRQRDGSVDDRPRDECTAHHDGRRTICSAWSVDAGDIAFGVVATRSTK